VPVPNAADAIEHYQSQVPLLRMDFARRLEALRRAHERAETLWKNPYVSDVYNIVAEEIIKRSSTAEQSLLAAIDAGWRPAENQLYGIWADCFTPTHYERDSFSDIKGAIGAITTGIGRPVTTEVHEAFEMHIGRIQVMAAERSLADLKMRLRKIAQLAAPAETSSIVRESDAPSHLGGEASKNAQVFVTHGRDRVPRDAVADFIRSVGLHPIVLEDEPNAGLTIIEKFEKYSNVGYGIIILSPDDFGCLKTEPSALRPRARQNVIFEFGYMLARVGRNRVAVLLTDRSIERPANVDGIVWIDFDSDGNWKDRLRVELRAAGYGL